MVKISKDLCTGCGECVASCPHAALALEGKPGKAKVVASERCMECGACRLNCPEAAINGNFGVSCFGCMTQEKLSGKPSSGNCAC